jgi:hypothetical protein
MLNMKARKEPKATIPKPSQPELVLAVFPDKYAATSSFSNARKQPRKMKKAMPVSQKSTCGGESLGFEPSPARSVMHESVPRHEQAPPHGFEMAPPPPMSSACRTGRSAAAKSETRHWSMPPISVLPRPKLLEFESAQPPISSAMRE